MSDFPGRPLLLKGGLVVFEAPIPVPTNLILFQYNPETMTRKISQPAGGSQAGGGGSANPCSTAGDTRNNLLLPTESYQLAVELDAADQMEINDPVTRFVGLHPALAALELLLYPPPQDVLVAKALSLFGSAFVTSPKVPIVLFVWGAARVVPVIVNSITVTEQAYDQLLNPIQAKVDLDMRSMTQIELQNAGILFESLAFINLVAKEIMARFQAERLVTKAAINAVKSIKGHLPF
ncbi:MAG TPA: hypothetical protein VK129_10300 [Terriglobales bacterium]|nr:hypothetical protein [Terriglobales bacterium]